MSAARRRLAGAISTMALLIAVVGDAPALATDGLVVDQDQIVHGEEGSTLQLAEVAIDDRRIGSLCTLRAHTENQYSVHPGNDLLITTGGVQTVIADIEAEAEADRDRSAGVVLGPVLLIELRFGPDQVSSMGFDLSVDCPITAPVVVESDPCPDPSSPAAPDGGCSDPTPVSEVEVPKPTLPEPCGPGFLTVSPDSCDQPTTTVAPGPPPPPTGSSTTSPPPTTAAAVVSRTTGPTPTVEGLQISRDLPQTPAAPPIQAAPAYTG